MVVPCRCVLPEPELTTRAMLFSVSSVQHASCVSFTVKPFCAFSTIVCHKRSNMISPHVRLDIRTALKQGGNNSIFCLERSLVNNHAPSLVVRREQRWHPLTRSTFRKFIRPKTRAHIAGWLGSVTAVEPRLAKTHAPHVHVKP